MHLYLFILNIFKIWENIEINYRPDLEYVSKTHPAAAGRTCR